MRRTARRRLFSFAIVFALLGVAVTAGIVVLPWVARDRIAHELAASGFEDARFDVSQVGLTRVVLSDVVLGPDLSVEELAVEIAPLALQIESMTLIGARFTTAFTEEALEASTPARLLAQDAGSGGATPTIHLERATLIATTARGPVEVEVDGDVGPEGEAALTLRSGLGEHDVSVHSWETTDERGFDIVGAGSGDALNVSIRVHEDGPVSVQGRAVIGGWASRGVRADAARLIGSALIDGGQVAALDLRASASGLALDDTVIGHAELRATRDDAIAWRLSTRGDEGLEVHARGRLSPDPAAWIPAFEWTVRGPVPAPLVERAADFLALPGDPRVALTGDAQLDEGRWIARGIEGQIAVDTLQIPDAELVLDGVRVALRAHAQFDDGRMEILIEPGSRLHAARTRLDALGLDALEASPELRIVEDAEGLRVHARRPIDTRMERLTIGEGPSALGFEDVTMTLSSNEGAPIATSVGARTTLAARMEASAPRIRGLLRGRGTHARGAIDVAIVDGADPQIAIPLEIRASQLEETESELALANVRVRLPLRWEQGNVAAEGEMRAARMSWREIPVGRTSGTVEVGSDALTLGWIAPATRDAHFRFDARIGLDDEASGQVRVQVPRTFVEEGDPVQRVLAELTDQVITGPIDGEVHLDLSAPERGDARLAFHGADLLETGGGLGARQVRGTLRLGNLDPIVTAAPADLTWKHLELGGVKLDAGSARLTFAAPTDVLVDDMRVVLAGGQIDVAPLRFDREAPELALDLVVRGVELEQLLQAATNGGIHGEGKLDGRVALHLALGKERRILLGDGHLASRGPGTLRFEHDTKHLEGKLEVGDLVSGSFIRRRVLAAIEDFAYQRLSMNVVGEGTRHVRARVVGRGKRMPQELDMTLNFRGVQPLLDHAVRLWPSGAEASIELETP